MMPAAEMVMTIAIIALKTSTSRLLIDKFATIFAPRLSDGNIIKTECENCRPWAITHPARRSTTNRYDSAFGCARSVGRATLNGKSVPLLQAAIPAQPPLL
jgi:hypothetical protein